MPLCVETVATLSAAVLRFVSVANPDGGSGTRRLLNYRCTKTLNVAYDSGIAIVADSAALYAAMGVHAGYLIQDDRPDPMASVPEFFRRARGLAAWASLPCLGRVGVAEMVERFAATLDASRSSWKKSTGYEC